MPFTTTSTQPSINALVTVKFAGLMLLKPGPNDTCTVGVHRWASTHTFQVILVVHKRGRPPSFIRLLTGPLNDDFVIRLNPDHAGDFKAFAATPGTLEANNDNARDYPLDYRWRLNLKQFHPNADYNEGATPEVKLKTGVLYTSNLTPEDLDPKLVRPDVPLPLPLKYFAADLAVAIQPPATSKVILEWRELGEPQGISLPRERDEEGTTYTVSLMNDPPISYPATHDELALYYKILMVGGQLIPIEQRWRMTYAYNERLDEIPCMPGTLEP
ncbi:MAG TPA: hypothetical protein VJU86_18015 [Pyrinomonadaceae bacterium]|nr:hypothetical protein [Pyrinomonadaceae bacterium]